MMRVPCAYRDEKLNAFMQPNKTPDINAILQDSNDAVADVLAKGYRTGDLMNSSPPGTELKQVGCTQMGELLLESIAEEEIKLSFMPK